jgi:hypothetical protein
MPQSIASKNNNILRTDFKKKGNKGFQKEDKYITSASRIYLKINKRGLILKY